MKRTLLTILITAACIIHCAAQTGEVSGRLVLDSTWGRQVYISYIANFSQMYTASVSLITGRGEIDSAGNFTVKFPLQNQPSLYRLHIIKKGDPVSTLIIGGKDENHVFFIADTATHIYFNHINANTPLNQAEVGYTNANTSLQHFFGIINPVSAEEGPVARLQLKNNLVRLADTTPSQLVSLLAISSTFGLDEGQKSKVSTIVARLDKSNPYGQSIFEQYKQNSVWYFFVPAILLSCIAAVIILFRYRKKKAAVKLFNSLTQRELIIIKHIINGKTNKEIAAEFNVELSTIKTHVNNLYNKLNVKDRKEVLAYNALFKKHGLGNN